MLRRKDGISDSLDRVYLLPGTAPGDVLLWDGEGWSPFPLVNWYAPVLADLWDSDSTRPPFSEIHLDVINGPATIVIRAIAAVGLNAWPNMKEIAVYNNGALLSVENVSSNGSQILVNLPAGANNVVVREGPNAYDWTGVRVSAIASIEPIVPLAPVPPQHRITVFGDSIATGFLCTNPTTDAWSQILKTSLSNTDVTCHSGGGWTLAQFASTPGLIASTVAVLGESFDGTIDSTLWIALGYNDAHSQTAATTWGTWLANLLDALHTAYPALIIYVQSPITATVETFGTVTLQQYREAVAAVCGRRGPWARNVNGANQINAAPLVDGIHPGTIGNANYATSVKEYLTWNPFVAGVGIGYFDGYSFTPADWFDKFNVNPAPAVDAGVSVPEDAGYGNQDIVNLATTKYYQSGVVTEAQPLTIMVIGATADAAGAYFDAVSQFCLVGGVNGTDLGTFLGTGWLAAPGVDITQKHCAVVEANGVNTKIWVDSSAAPAIIGDAGADGIAGGFFIGKRHNNSDAWSKDAACVIVWRGALATADIAKMMVWAGREFGAAWS